MLKEKLQLQAPSRDPYMYISPNDCPCEWNLGVVRLIVSDSEIRIRGQFQGQLSPPRLEEKYIWQRLDWEYASLEAGLLKIGVELPWSVRVVGPR